MGLHGKAMKSKGTGLNPSCGTEADTATPEALQELFLTGHEKILPYL